MKDLSRVLIFLRYITIYLSFFLFLCLILNFNLFVEYIAVRRFQVCVVIQEMFLNSESVFLVKLKGTFVVALDMKSHSFNFPFMHAFLYGFLKKLRCDSISFVRFKHSDCHDIADSLASIEDILFA